MEKDQPQSNERVQVTRSVFEGLEFIRNSGVTNMFDRPTVLSLAREWDFTETADWIESVDTGTYGRLIVQGPDVIEDDVVVQEEDTPELQTAAVHEAGSSTIENDADSGTNEIDGLDQVREDMRTVIIALSKQATLVIADTYETEQMGVFIDPSRHRQINEERHALNRNLAEASRLWVVLDETMTEIQRGIGSLQYMIDPENN